MTKQQTKEKKNKKRGAFFTFFIHGSIVALALMPFLTITPPKDVKEEKWDKKAKAIMINFATSKPKAPKRPKAAEAPPKVEELKPIPVKPSPKPKAKPAPKPAPKPVAVPTPRPKPTPRPSPKPVVTAPAPDVPAVPTPTAPPAPAPPAPVASPAPAAPSPAPASAPAASTTSSTAANGTSGNSESPNSTEDGAEDGEESGNGVFGRQVVYRPNIKNLTKKSGKIQVELCVNRDGKVVSTRYIEDGSNMDDDDLIHATQVAAKKYKFEKDYTVAAKQCGKLTFVFSIED